MPNSSKPLYYIEVATDQSCPVRKWVGHSGTTECLLQALVFTSEDATQYVSNNPSQTLVIQSKNKIDDVSSVVVMRGAA